MPKGGQVARSDWWTIWRTAQPGLAWYAALSASWSCWWAVLAEYTHDQSRLHRIAPSTTWRGIDRAEERINPKVWKPALILAGVDPTRENGMPRFGTMSSPANAGA